MSVPILFQKVENKIHVSCIMYIRCVLCNNFGVGEIYL